MVQAVFNLLKPTGFVHQQISHLGIVHSTHIAFICFVFISEQTVTSVPYNKN